MAQVHLTFQECRAVWWCVTLIAWNNSLEKVLLVPAVEYRGLLRGQHVEYLWTHCFSDGTTISQFHEKVMCTHGTAVMVDVVCSSCKKETNSQI